jgi:hypothetical protein
VVRDRTLPPPYGVTHNFAAFARVNLDDLVGAMT